MDVLTAVLTVGLAARITRLIVADKITHPVRARIVVRLGPDHPVAVLACCGWCMSVWVAAGVCVAGYFWADHRWWLWVALAGTASWLYGIAASWLDQPYTGGDDQ